MHLVVIERITNQGRRKPLAPIRKVLASQLPRAGPLPETTRPFFVRALQKAPLLLERGFERLPKSFVFKEERGLQIVFVAGTNRFGPPVHISRCGHRSTSEGSPR